MSDELMSLLSELQRFELTVLTKDSFKVGAALLSDFPPDVTQANDVYRILDYLVTELFPARFDPPLTFQWAGGPADGRKVRVEPDEEDFESEDEFDDASQEYWEHFGEPAPWQELAHPVRALLLENVRWTINNKRYRVQRPFGRALYVPYSMAPNDQEAIKTQEAEHQRQREKLVDLFLTGIAAPFRCFHTNHVLEPQSAEKRGWELHRDEAFAILDPVHVRMLWTLRDREYG